MVEEVVSILNIRALIVLLIASLPAIAGDKPRLLVLTDIGGDPDDQQSMIRLMVHANEFEIEGLIASAAGIEGELKKETVKPELIREIVEAYGKVQPNLRKHHPDFPESKVLLDRIKSGNPVRGTGSLGEDKDTEGSKWIISAVDRADERPLNVVIWGGSTELAQALWRVRHDRTQEELDRFVAKLRVYSIGHQDNTGPWINKEYPNLFFILSKSPEGKDRREGGYRGMYLGGDQSLTSREWVDRHICKDHGALGALYPTNTWTAPNPHGTLKEGDTPSWLYFLPVGLGDTAHPEWGSWGGRFKHVAGGRYEDSPDTVGKENHQRATVYRWRPAFQNEFQARMDWCVKSPKEANHPPVAGLNMDVTGKAVRLDVKPSERAHLSAADSSDPDGDKLTYHWFVYKEAGDYVGDVKVEAADKMEAAVVVPADAKGKTIHVVLAVSDDGKPPLTRYRRAVLAVR
ncbi:MAG TPA: nucleoside hydrolase-like domain-containing protein [Gemmataceae bacterium]|nr:nucleoside hydrolase-like domain-containing protein [Gemmataceae bacterium]